MASLGPRDSGCLPPLRKSASKSPGTSATFTGPYAVRPCAVATSTSGSSQYAPREPLRMSCSSSPRAVASRAIACATSPAPSERAPASRGTYTVKVMREQSPLAVELRQQRVEALRGHPAMQPVIDHHRGRAGAVAQAVDRLQREPPVGCRLMEVYSQPPPRVRSQRLTPYSLTRFRPAHVHGMRPRARAAKEMVERDDAVDLCAREIELRCHERYRRRRDVPELCLNRVQHLDQRPGPPLEVPRDPPDGRSMLRGQ